MQTPKYFLGIVADGFLVGDVCASFHSGDGGS